MTALRQAVVVKRGVSGLSQPRKSGRHDCRGRSEMERRVVTTPYFIGTKLEAFRGRGKVKPPT